MVTTPIDIPLESSNGSSHQSFSMKQLKFKDYDDLQTRLVLLPRDEDDEGIGAVISMYYCYPGSSTDHTPKHNEARTASDVVMASNSNSLILDDSITGYALLNISSVYGADENDTAVAATSMSDHEKVLQSSNLFQEDFASILATIRNHPTPIVLTIANLPTTGSSESEDDATDADMDTNTSIASVKGDANTSHNTPIIEENDVNNTTSELAGGVVFEEEKKSEDGTTFLCTNTVPTNPPPPPSDSLKSNKDVKVSSLSLSPNHTLFTTTKHLSSWTSRMSAVAVTKATALAKAANEQAKVTSAMVAAAVVPEFPNTTVSTTSASTTSTSASTTPATNKTSNTINTTTSETSNDATDVTTSITTATATTTNGNKEKRMMPSSNGNDQDTKKPQTLSMPASELVQSATSTTTLPTESTKTNLGEVHPRISLPELHIFVQSETGTFIPVPEVVSEHPLDLVSLTKPNQALLTNSSYIMLRVNAQQPVPINTVYRYQWYRSCSTSTNSSNNTWVKLPGATGPTLQPSATEIGYRLRCVVSSNDSNDNENENDAKLICETADIVTAAMPILNGSRQALARGAQFGGLLGQGKAEGRTFRIKIVLSSCSSNAIDRRKSLSDNGSSSHHSTSSRSTVAAVTIYQVAGMTAEPIHPEHEPLYCRAATVWDYSQIKNIALTFHSNDISPSASMVAALCSTDNEDEDDEIHELANQRLYFRLQAPNRLARESMLLSLGIANFQGKPSDLNACSILFHQHHFNECSGSASSSLGDDSIVSQSSSIAWQPMSTGTPEKITVERRMSSFGGIATDEGMKSDLEEELLALRNKLSRKDKVISELQRQVTHSDEIQRQTEAKLCSMQKALDESQKELVTLRKSLTDANGKLEKVSSEVQNIKSEHDAQCGAFACDIQIHKDRIVALERENRTLQNDKDVLKAAVESRDFKLFKMEELQASLDEARVKLAQRNNFQLELDEANKRYGDTLKEVERLKMSNNTYCDEKRIAHERIESLEEALRAETNKFSSHQSKVEMEQMKVQKLKAERNSYKQKAESLSKEMSRICRDGRTIREIEKILADDATRREEVNVLREQKRKAIEQVEHFRTAYEQSLSIQKLSGIDHDAGKLLERNAELERLLSELTEYLNAKEMQLDTMKQVNDTLQSEIRNLARASMSKNDI